MKTRYKLTTILAIFLVILTTCLSYLNTHSNQSHEDDKKSTKTPVIGILLPMEHTALTDMVAGFKESLNKNYPHSVQINLQNAQGDIKLQRSILEQFKGQNVDIVVTIGTTSAQMAISLIDKQPIISLAALLPEIELMQRANQITNVVDEIGGSRKIHFLKKIFPKLQKITILSHSGNEKNYSEITEIITTGKEQGIEIQNITIQTLPELKMASAAIAPDSQLILILKDHLIASGVKLILPIIEARKIPLIASDEGSVKEGAAFALGMSERKIGEFGGKLAAEILSGTEIQNLPRSTLGTLTVFYNATATKNQEISVENLQKVAEQQKYLFEQIKK